MNIKIGDKLEISYKKDNELGKSFVSQVENILEESIILVSMPVSYGKMIKLPVGSGYLLLFFTEKGMLRFDASVVKYVKDGNVPLLVLRLDSSGEKMQRRNFFRYQCLLPLKFSVIDEENLSGNNYSVNEMHTGVTKDIGGGGLRFVSNADISGYSKINVIVMLGKEYFVAIAKVLYKLTSPNSNYKFQYRTGFISILPEEQEKIIQYIFNEQRKKVQIKME